MEEDVMDTNGDVASDDSSRSSFELQNAQSGTMKSVKQESQESEEVGTSLDDMEKQTFSFETDHLALMNNVEYKSILKIFVLLEAQRINAIQDINELEKAKKEALENPDEFLRKLKEDSLELPLQQVVPEVPEVDFSKYSISQKCIPSTSTETRSSVENPPVCSEEPVKQLTKSGTFNKPWSVEEQWKLEELLKKYPPEAVEARRWKKIADELGNRSIKQVASRVQKYFIKLTRAGLDVPGRTPHIPKSTKKVRRVQSTLKTQTYFLSTFFPQHLPSVLMDDQPTRELPVKAENVPMRECSSCGNKLGTFYFRCDNDDCCDASPMFCSDDCCHRNSNCGQAGHSIKIAESESTQRDADYVFENHYLDPNYVASSANS